MDPKKEQPSEGEQKPGLGLTPLEDVRAIDAKARASEADEFESEWRDDQDGVEPLTDAVRAARLKAAQRMSEESDEFASAFNEQEKA